ncbi:protein kinase domain protein [Rubidibacter lacunae KORDI 51-2]|uniref:Protein kinase domain protein n=1 Tax=Rubidibacter lacunae KORDI 51-2 TaxID=582515 RepID=U5DNZ6_9CHRO|nr:serine/threonine-protein kinase [Rubidibacter lacunae]ERN41430.1 protein kinase domain protein [Rubidibacter lacunae KORDI 51-2]
MRAMLQENQVLQERYQLRTRLGQTGAGRQTWLTADLQARELVVLKLLAFGPHLQWEELRLFEREAEVLRALDHPRIPSYRDYFALDAEVSGGLTWFGLVQSYIPGASLQNMLDAGKHFLPWQVKQIATDVLRILIYLHELCPPVLHRDIKPSNLIWGEDDRVYLVDFGAVQAKAAVTGVTFTVVGTGGYAPLEQFWERALPASDLYALGATLIHLLTGVPPIDLTANGTRIRFRDRLEVEPRFALWLETATEVENDNRYAKARDALEALQSCATDSPLTASHHDPLPAPSYSPIVCRQTRDRLEVCIPSPGLHRLMRVGTIPGGIALTFVAWLMVVILIYIPASVPFASFAVPFTVIWVWGLWKLLEYFCERTQIVADRSRLHLRHFILPIFARKRELALDSILEVVMRQQGGTFDVCLRCRDGNIGLGVALDEEESVWLVQKIQEWLRSPSSP